MVRHISHLQKKDIAAEHLFLLFSLIGGLLLLALIPPMGGGNETLNFQRSAQLSAGHILIKPVSMPIGISELLTKSGTQFPEGTVPPYSYSGQNFGELSSITLQADRHALVEPSPIAVLHPLAYVAQIPTIALGMLLGFSPLVLFYLGRAAGMLVGVALTFYAIRIAPSNKFLLAALAMLPPILFSRSTLDADQLTNGVAFLFFALLAREVSGEGPLAVKRIVAMVVTAAILAQAKSAYLLLPLLSLAIPASRFGARGRRAMVIALLTLPGVLGSVAWMLVLRQGYFHDAAYVTWSGEVMPDEQIKYVLFMPVEYLGVLTRTIFTTPLVPRALLDLIGVFGPPVSIPTGMYPVLAVLLMSTGLSEDRVPLSNLHAIGTRVLASALALVTMLIILTLLYLQWTRFHGRVIDGFNGRYLYPLLPGAALLIRGRGERVFGLTPSKCLILISVLSVTTTLWVTLKTYWT